MTKSPSSRKSVPVTNECPDAAPALPDPWRHFGALLRDRRNAAGWSRLDLASRAKVSDATIKFIETARHRPSRATLIRLLRTTELQLLWADVPGNQELPVELQNPPALPPPAPSLDPEELRPDSAHFLMNLIGFDELLLPQDAPKNLRIFQQRHDVAAKVDDE